jgi:hypothetical protein
MSAIAAFFVLPHDHLDEVVDSAMPRQRGWFRPAQDKFREVLRAHSRELDDFCRSGWAFASLDIYLRDRYGLAYDDFGDGAASDRLTKARGSSWLVLPTAAIGELRGALDKIEPTARDVSAFVASEHGPDEADEEAEAVMAALAALKGWLAQAPDGSVGLLSVG